MRWKGPVSAFLRDTTREIDLEGALSSGKTTACLWKVRTSTIEYPGIWWYIGRFSDGDTQTKICPAFEHICQQSGETPRWNPEELAYDFANGSKVYAFGLKSQDHLARYSKLRGLGVAGIYNDQTEELPEDIADELRARLRQPGYPHQLIFSPNPPNVTHWLARQFPEHNQLENRTYYAVSLYDNAHNLPPDMVRSLEQAYPPEHPKHRSVILGKRGLNVIGQPVYRGMFIRPIHHRPIPYDTTATLLEAVDFGKHHPCWIAAQQPYSGGVQFLGGILGQDLFLDDFLPIVKQYRARWFDPLLAVQSCCDPAGSHQSSQGIRSNGVQILHEHGIWPVWKENSNAPDVRYAMVERLGAHMRRRTPQGEAFGVNSDPRHWLRVSKDGVEEMPFLADAFEAGYVWDEHMVSVGSKQVRKPKKDGWYEHGMNCAEYLELNFGAEQETREEQEQARARAKASAPAPSHVWVG